MKSSEPDIQIYSKDDPQQYKDNRQFWDEQTPEYKLMALETIRIQWLKFGKTNAKQLPRFRRVLRVIEQK